MLQKASRQKNVNTQTKQMAVSALSGKSIQQSEKIIAEIFKLPRQEDLIRIEVTLTKEQFEKLEQVKALLSHQVPKGELARVIEVLCDQQITQKLNAAVAVKSENKTLTLRTKKHILQRDQCCQFISPLTGKKCASKWQLQIDHIQPLWAQGKHDPKNLQVLCGNHNRLKYQKEAGIRTG